MTVDTPLPKNGGALRRDGENAAPQPAAVAQEVP